MDLQVGESLDGLSFIFCSTLIPAFPLDRRNSGLNFEKGWGGSNPQLVAIPNLWIWSLLISPLGWAFQLMSSQFCLESLLLLYHQGLSVGYPQFPISHCYTTLFNSLTLHISPPSPLTLDPAPFFLLPLSLSPKPFSLCTSCDYFAPTTK